MEGKELLQYGFKRVIEEINSLQGVAENIKVSTLSGDKKLREALKLLGSIENNLITLNESMAKCCGYLSKIAACELVTEQHVLRLEKFLKEGREDENAD